MSIYETLKRYLWPHTAIPLAVIVAIDYVNLVGHIAQIFLAAYLMLQLLSFCLGFVAAAFLHFSPESPWGTVFKYNVVRFFPLMSGGRVAFDFLMAEVEEEKAKLSEEFWCRDCGTGNDANPPDHTMDCETRVVKP